MLKTTRLLVVILLLGRLAVVAAPSERWSERKANEWYGRQPWLVGSNYVPATAVNELEMWQADTFDPRRIDLELGWAEGLGMNTMRVFLHDLLWQQDPEGFRRRIDAFLAIAARHRIRPVFVLFDSVWDPNPRLGRQPAPRPGVHNSRWVQSPGRKALEDPAERPRLEAYVKGVVDAFAWAREAGATQPLTSGVWKGDWSSPEKMTEMERTQLELSDVLTFHNYDPPTELEKRVRWLVRYGRPVICTEYMARGNGSFFTGSLPVFKLYRVGAINWGLVQGKAQTNLPWDSWEHPYTDREPTVWFHEVFRTDGRPYLPEEAQYIRRMTGRAAVRAAAR